MCGIFGIKSFARENKINPRYAGLSLIAHRGPDATNHRFLADNSILFIHHRLSIIDLQARGNQPMGDSYNRHIIFNGEIYNYKALRQQLCSYYDFKTATDTEVILAAYDHYGENCVDHLRGMFAFAIWDEKCRQLFCARDRFGIKPFYYTVVNDQLFFASEAKALIPFLEKIETNYEALSEYFAFQYTLGIETLFKNIYKLMPGHYLTVKNSQVTIRKYWDVKYEIDYDHSKKYFENLLRDLINDSIHHHLISDVAVGSYLSGGIDSSLITSLAADMSPNFYGSFHGKFTEYSGFDESQYAKSAAADLGKSLYQTDIKACDFLDNIESVIYHLDYPVAGPGSFSQFMVSKLTAEHVKVVLGGQGGDEIFGGYARYIIAYFEQTIRASIEGNLSNGSFIVTPQSIIPNLSLLEEYKPLMQSFWREGLFGPLDERYFRLINRSIDNNNEINSSLFNQDELLERFKLIFNASDNVHHEAYFDKMTHFDFKCLLPALLQVEDRMSMAHGLESRVPFLDHPIIEFAATIPANIKFPGGQMKSLLRNVYVDKIPKDILNRRDKMGFPVPLKEWFSGPLKEFIFDIFSSQQAKGRGFYYPDRVLNNLNCSGRFSRKVWGLLSLELWHRIFHDRHDEFKKKLF